MKALIKVVLYEKGKIDRFEATITEDNWKIAKAKIEYTKNKIIKKLKMYHKEGIIKSIYRPRNWEIQKELNELVKAKKQATRSIETIKQIFA